MLFRDAKYALDLIHKVIVGALPVRDLHMVDLHNIKIEKLPTVEVTMPVQLAFGNLERGVSGNFQSVLSDVLSAEASSMPLPSLPYMVDFATSSMPSPTAASRLP